MTWLLRFLNMVTYFELLNSNPEESHYQPPQEEPILGCSGEVGLVMGLAELVMARSVAF